MLVLPTELIRLVAYKIEEPNSFFNLSVTCKRVSLICDGLKETKIEQLMKKTIDETYCHRTEYFTFHNTRNGFCRIWRKFPVIHLVKEYYYKNNLKNGSYKKWYSCENPQLEKECSYKDNKKNGVYKEWYPDGKPKVECEYKKGILTGYYFMWDEHGRVRDEYYEPGTLFYLNT